MTTRYRNNVDVLRRHVESLANALLAVEMACEALEQGAGTDELEGVLLSATAGNAAAYTRKLVGQLAQWTEVVK